MKARQNGRILFLIKALVALIFISKISLGSLLPIPSSYSFLVFQSGLHPYVNIFLCFLFGLPLMFLGLRVRQRNHLSGFYKLFVLVLMLTLLVQTILQVNFVNRGESVLMQMGALAVALLMVFLYGLLIPSLWDVNDFVNFVQRWSGALVLISILLLCIASGNVFKGGRFIGVFKHIPHMVTCATVAFIFSLATFLQGPFVKHKIWSFLVLLASLIAIVLTGTRSAAAAALFAFVITMILHRTVNNQGRLLKFALLSSLIVSMLFFGGPTYDFVRALATGQSALGAREAQDGIATRWDEVERGIHIFNQEPWLGHGLVSKFVLGNDVDVTNYNAMKDPHNIFISAGVVGGWPLVILSFVSIIFMVIGSLKLFKALSIFHRQVAVYLLAHIPILVIYHIHLSIGGMADRLYWMVFGFVAASMSINPAATQLPGSRP